MKARITILVMIYFLFALDTTTQAPVLDYVTGEPIRRLDGCVIKAFQNGSQYYVDDRGSAPYVCLILGEQPLRSIRLHYLGEADSVDDNITVSTAYHIRFSDSTDYWNNLGDIFRISETPGGMSSTGGRFGIRQAEESRVYELYLDTTLLPIEIGMVESFFNGHHYYLSSIAKVLGDDVTPAQRVTAAAFPQIPLKFMFEKANL